MNNYIGIGNFEDVFNAGLRLDRFKELNPNLNINYSIYIGENSSYIDVKICKKE